MRIHGTTLTKESDFHSLEVVGRDRETQLQVGQKMDYLAFKGLNQQLDLLILYYERDT